MIFQAILFWKCVLALRPVVFMHGYGGSYTDFDYFVKYIEKYHPTQKTFPLHIFPKEDSKKPLDEQIPGVVKMIEDLKMQHNFSSFHFVAHSQGGMIARGVIESTKNLGVANFITLSSPHMGYFGKGCGHWGMPDWFQHFVLHDASLVMYTDYLQKSFCIANYWRDPDKTGLFLKKCHFLSQLNNETFAPKSEEQKTNFLSLEKVVLFGGKDDECIKPWESALFGYYKEGDMKSIVPMSQQEVYQRDSFGLKSLNESGRLFIYSIPNMKHIMWIQSEEFFKNYVLQYLD